jgi:hypothetical protein
MSKKYFFFNFFHLLRVDDLVQGELLVALDVLSPAVDEAGDVGVHSLSPVLLHLLLKRLFNPEF